MLSLVSLPLLVHALGVAEFGRYVAALALAAIFALAGEFGLTAVALRAFGRADAAERGGEVAHLLGLRAGAAGAGVVAAVGVAALIGWPAYLVAGTALAGVGALAQVWIDFAIVGLTGTLRFGRAAVVDLTRAGLATLGVLALALADASTLLFFAGYAGAGLVAAALGGRLAAGVITLRPVVDRERWKQIARAVAPYSLAAVVYVVHFRIVVILVAMKAPGREAGYFATSFRVVEFVTAAAGVAAAGAIPWLSRQARDSQALERRARDVLAVGLVAGALVAGAVFVGAGLIVDVIAGASGRPAADVMRIQSLSILAAVAAFAGGAVLLAAGRYRDLLFVNLAALTVTVGLALPLISTHGARGAAAAAAAGDFVLLAGQVAALRVVMNRRWRG